MKYSLCPASICQQAYQRSNHGVIYQVVFVYAGENPILEWSFFFHFPIASPYLCLERVQIALSSGQGNDLCTMPRKHFSNAAANPWRYSHNKDEGNRWSDCYGIITTSSNCQLLFPSNGDPITREMDARHQTSFRFQSLETFVRTIDLMTKADYLCQLRSREHAFLWN